MHLRNGRENAEAGGPKQVARDKSRAMQPQSASASASIGSMPPGIMQAADKPRPPTLNAAQPWALRLKAPTASQTCKVSLANRVSSLVCCLSQPLLVLHFSPPSPCHKSLRLACGNRLLLPGRATSV